MCNQKSDTSTTTGDKSALPETACSAKLDKLADQITHSIFEMGVGHGDECRRIEFKVGRWELGTETGNGGLNRNAFRRCIREELGKFFS